MRFQIKLSHLCKVKQSVGIVMYALAIAFWLIHAFIPHHHHSSFIPSEQWGVDRITATGQNPLHDWLEVDLGSNHLNLGLRKSAENSFSLPLQLLRPSIDQALCSIQKVENTSFSLSKNFNLGLKSRFKSTQPGRVPVGHSPPLV